MERFLRHKQIFDKKVAPHENPENKPKISLSQLQRYTKFTFRYMFLRMTKRIELAKKLYVSSKLSKSKMAANYGQSIIFGIKSINMPFSILPWLRQNKKFFRSNEYKKQIRMLAVKNQRYMADGVHYK